MQVSVRSRDTFAQLQLIRRLVKKLYYKYEHRDICIANYMEVVNHYKYLVGDHKELKQITLKLIKEYDGD